MDGSIFTPFNRTRLNEYKDVGGVKKSLNANIQGFTCVESSMYFVLVVPPRIEPFTSVYSNSLNDCTFLLYLL